MENAIPAKSETCMKVAKFSVGARATHFLKPEGMRRNSMSFSANVNDSPAATATVIAATMSRRRSSSRCCRSDSSLSRSALVTAIQ